MALETFSEGCLELKVAGIARLTLNRPHVRNAVSERMWAGLIEACRRIEGVPEIRVLIISGEGNHFCAGADISEFGRVYSSNERVEAYNDLYRQAKTAIRNLSVPVIAEVKGACMGAGLGLSLSADLRFADETAQIAVTASKLGLAYSPDDSARLIATIGLARAKDMLFSARTIEATEASSWGLVDRVVPGKQLSAIMNSYAAELAERSPASLAATKMITDSLVSPDLKLCGKLQPFYDQLFSGEDIVEGRSAFLEKRPPRFRRS
ncbi:enoyl-CoA hydratase/isomerase family protein [Bradyrhizobium sp. Arg314]